MYIMAIILQGKPKFYNNYEKVISPFDYPMGPLGFGFLQKSGVRFVKLSFLIFNNSSPNSFNLSFSYTHIYRISFFWLLFLLDTSYMRMNTNKVYESCPGTKNRSSTTWNNYTRQQEQQV